MFAALLRLPLPPDVLVGSYYFITPIALPAGIALSLCHKRRDWIGVLAGLTITLALFALPLATLWQHFASHYNAVGGLLPFSDASGYYYDARRLTEGHTLGWSARRPLFAALFGTLLATTGQNLQISLAALVAINAIVTFLLARELRVSHGPVAAAVVTVVLFLYYRIEGGSGTVLTENLGLAMGIVACAVLWRGSWERRLRGVWLGLGLLTVALMSRAGAFFVLPAVLLAGTWAFRENRQWLRFAVGGAAAVVIAATLTLGVGRLLSDPAGEQTTFSNFSYSLYGLVVGGKGWTQVLIDHPKATEGAEIYSLAWQAFRAHPAGLVQGSLKMWGEYLGLVGTHHAFAFVRDSKSGRLFQVVCYGLSALGLALAIGRHRQPAYLLVLAGTLGHLGSIPFVPPMDAGLRVYAATMPLLAILPSLGAARLVEWGRRLTALVRPVAGPAAQDQVKARTGPGAEVFGVALAAVVFAGPLCVLYTSHPPTVRDMPCPSGALPVSVRVSNGSYLRILGPVPDVDETRVAVPEIRERDMRASTDMDELKNDGKEFTAGRTMINTHDLKTGRSLWLIAPTSLVPEPQSVFHVCGRDSPDPLSRRYGVFYAVELPEARPSR